MIAHQAVGMTPPMKPLGYLGENVQKELAVGVVIEDRLTFVAAGGEVIQSTIILDS
jgi:hypothetical protein